MEKIRVGIMTTSEYFQQPLCIAVGKKSDREKVI